MQYFPTPSHDSIINAGSGSAKLFNKNKPFRAELVSAHENPTLIPARWLDVLGKLLDPEVHRSEFLHWSDILTTTP